MESLYISTNISLCFCTRRYCLTSPSVICPPPSQDMHMKHTHNGFLQRLWLPYFTSRKCGLRHSLHSHAMCKHRTTCQLLGLRYNEVCLSKTPNINLRRYFLSSTPKEAQGKRVELSLNPSCNLKPTVLSLNSIKLGTSAQRSIICTIVVVHYVLTF